MDKGLTLDQVLYAALKNDLVENRHTDAVLSFFDEGAAKVVHSAGCHRIALTAKSSLFHNILVENQVEIEFNFFPKHKFLPAVRRSTCGSYLGVNLPPKTSDALNLTKFNRMLLISQRSINCYYKQTVTIRELSL